MQNRKNYFRHFHKNKQKKVYTNLNDENRHLANIYYEEIHYSFELRKKCIFSLSNNSAENNASLTFVQRIEAFRAGVALLSFLYSYLYCPMMIKCIVLINE